MEKSASPINRRFAQSIVHNFKQGCKSCCNCNSNSPFRLFPPVQLTIAEDFLGRVLAAGAEDSAAGMAGGAA